MPATEKGPGPRAGQRVALLANPDSGSGDAGSVEGELRRLGAEVFALEPDEADAAVRLEPDRIVIAGGDGSLARPAAAAARAGIPIAVVPVGTANDFARHLGVPEDTRDACALALAGEPRPLDLAWLERRPFLNVASVGLAPAAARRADALKGALGPLAYAVGAVRAGVRAEPVRCAVICDGKPWFEGDAWQVTVACTGAFGGGSSVDADPHDGRLDVVVIEANGRAALVRHAWGLRRGTLAEQQGAAKRLCRTAELRFDGRRRFNVDGELVETESCSFSIEPGAVQVVAP
ncbi:MAG TPA: diacylglycerol kinase family protein [Solirubrobacterales bacterium]